VGSKPGRRGGNPTTNRLSYGTALILSYFIQDGAEKMHVFSHKNKFVDFQDKTFLITHNEGILMHF
jgi:hypothetical protein